jgi:ribosomal protein S18 acetylase RimI-like enzyme
MANAKSEVVVRPARRSDLPSLARLGAALARQHHRWDPERFFLREPLEEGYAWWLGKEVENPRAVVLAAARGRGQVVGYAYGRIEPRDWNSLRERCGIGIDLAVEPAARGRGVGRRLVAELVRELGRRGAPRVVIQVAARNRSAQRFFASLGFRQTMLEMTLEAPAVPAGPARREGARRPRR